MPVTILPSTSTAAPLPLDERGGGSDVVISFVPVGGTTTTTALVAGPPPGDDDHRAVLTHATFSIDECIVVVSASDHPSSPPNDIDGIIDGRPPPLSLSIVVVEALLDRVDVIDMSNPNMSRDDRARLTDEILRCSIDTPRRRTYRASKALHSKIGLLSPLLQLINSVLH